MDRESRNFRSFDHQSRDRVPNSDAPIRLR